MAKKKRGPTVIEAAGGLVWRGTGRNREIAVIHRPKYDDWTLPKGKLAQGEPWQHAALREVQEETGCSASLGHYAGSTAYTVDAVPKIVLFWNMTLVGECEFRPNEEVDQLLWLPVQEALEKITHPGEKALLMDSRMLSRRRPPFWGRIRRGWRRATHKRLARSLATFRVELDALLLYCTLERVSSAHWAAGALDLLAMTRHALDLCEIELGWRCFNAAQRFKLLGLAELSDDGLQMEAQAILREGIQKLSGWRKQTVQDLLGHKDELKDGVRVAEVYYAAQILHEHYDNMYHKLETLRSQMAFLALTEILAVIIFVVLAEPLLSIDVLANNQLLVVWAVLFGVLGAAFSGITSLSKGANGVRIPEALVNAWITLTRLATGAVSALVVYALLSAGLLWPGELTPGIVFATAFASGFSERLVVRTVETLTP